MFIGGGLFGGPIIIVLLKQTAAVGLLFYCRFVGVVLINFLDWVFKGYCFKGVNLLLKVKFDGWYCKRVNEVKFDEEPDCFRVQFESTN